MLDLVQLPPGSIFAGRYRVRGLLRAGGMGAVYDAVDSDERTGRRVALKLMRPEIVADPDARARFMREARVAAQIDSSNVVYVLDTGIDDHGIPYIVMEFLVGIEIGDLLKQRGRLPPAEVVSLLHQVGRGLDKAHAKGIVHRDLKPENLFLATRDDEAPVLKILDFGIAKVLESHDQHSTRSAGTPLYMAPEQTQRSTHVGPATDVWALGLMTYGMLVGRPYWESVDEQGQVNLNHLFREVLVTPLEPPSERARRSGVTLPTAFDTWFFQCVNRDPAQRTNKASQAVNALALALGAHAGEMSGMRIVADRIEEKRVVAAGSNVGATLPMAPDAREVLGLPRAEAPTRHEVSGTVIAPQAHAAMAQGTTPGVAQITQPILAAEPKAQGNDSETRRGLDPRVLAAVILGLFLLAGGGYWLMSTATKVDPAPASPFGGEDDDDPDPVVASASTKKKTAAPKTFPALGESLNPFLVVSNLSVQTHEVSRAEYSSYLLTLDEADRPAQRPLEWTTDVDAEPEKPVVSVGWEKANAYCVALSAHLPSNDEWTKSLGDDGFPKLTEGMALGLADPSPLECDSRSADHTTAGVADLVGNVQEWTSSPLFDGTMAIRGGHVGMPAVEAMGHVRGPLVGKPKAGPDAVTSSKLLGFRCFR